MVLINGNKYACETCIKGHRSSTCKHTDRPLFEIKKKGRPITQCEHCRELRKTKQVHIKCICEVKDEPSKESCSTKKGNGKHLGSAAFPNGLPEALEASVALRPPSEGVSSDSDHGSSCCCATGSECPCWTPRKHAPRTRKKKKGDKLIDHPSDSQPSDSSLPPELSVQERAHTPAHILARLSTLRPVLPRPPVQSNSSSSGHDLPPHHGSRLHAHEERFYSPYGRAYDQTHGTQHDFSPESDAAAFAAFMDSILPTLPASDSSNVNPPMERIDSSTEYGATPVSSCTCGDNCACPGCVQHNGGNRMPSAYATCQNPAACGGCLDCTILSLSAGANDGFQLLPSESSSINLDHWLAPPSLVDPAINTAGIGQEDAVTIPCGNDCACPSGGEGKRRCLGWKDSPVFEENGDISYSGYGLSSLPVSNDYFGSVDSLRSRSSSSSSSGSSSLTSDVVPSNARKAEGSYSASPPPFLSRASNSGHCSPIGEFVY